MESVGRKVNILRIPPEKLSPATLRAVIEELVTRDGTDYGASELSLEKKVAQVREEIASGKAILLFDRETQACAIVSRNDPRIKEIDTGD